MKKKIHFSRIVVAIVSFIAIFPFLWMILLSFKTDTQIMNSPFSLRKYGILTTTEEL